MKKFNVVMRDRTGAEFGYACNGHNQRAALIDAQHQHDDAMRRAAREPGAKVAGEITSTSIDEVE